MPKMTHWNSPDPIDVAPEKAATYSAQGWVVAGGKASEPAVTAVTTQSVDPVEEPKPAAKKTAKKSPAKKAAKKS